MKKLILTSLALIYLTTLMLAQPNLQWHQQASLPGNGEPRFSFSVDGLGYWGGINGNSTFWRYNPSNNNWTQLQNLPLPSSEMPAFTVNGIGYYMPISNGQIFVYRYNSAMDSWSQVSIFPGETRGGSFVFSIGNKVYMSMGMNSLGYHLSDVWEFDVNNYQFVQKSNFPYENRWGGSSFSINGKGYIGMGNLNWNFPQPNGNDLYEYNPIGDTWTQKANLPLSQGRYATAGFSMTNFGYILCGEGTNPLVFFDEFWRYDPLTDSWMQLPSFGGGGQNYLKTFVIDNTCFAGKGTLWSFNANNCWDNLSLNIQNSTLPTGSVANFTATTSDPSPSFVWQSDFGQGFQSLNNFGNYSGVNTNSLSISNVQLQNHNQPVRVISTSGECIDTSNVISINISDTCFFTINDTITNLISVTDTLLINTPIAGFITPNILNTIKVFPNPASTHITIDYGNFAIMNGYQLKIENSLGQQVFQTNISQQNDYLSLNDWGGNGLYFVHIIDAQGNTIEIRKIVLQ